MEGLFVLLAIRLLKCLFVTGIASTGPASGLRLMLQRRLQISYCKLTVIAQLLEGFFSMRL